jgi:hypothetical protein
MVGVGCCTGGSRKSIVSEDGYPGADTIGQLGITRRNIIKVRHVIYTETTTITASPSGTGVSDHHTWALDILRSPVLVRQSSSL